MLVRQNLLKEAVIRLLVACQTLSSSAERVLEEREDACAGIAKVEQGKIWFSNHSASGVVGPVLVSKETSDIVKVGWDVSASTRAHRQGMALVRRGHRLPVMTSQL